MSRRIRKATPKEQLLRVQAAAAAMVASANEGVPAERKISARSTNKIVNRAFARTKDLTFSQRKYQSLRDVSDFIAMSHNGKSNYASARNTDLLPIGNPVSTRKHLMSLSAFSYERARWVAADPRIEDIEVRSLVASLLSANPGSDEYSYYSSRISALPQKSAPLVALIAAFGDGNSRAARSARARLQRRDRKGRFAWMGGGMSALVRRTGGGVRRLTGRFVAQGVGDDDTFDIEAPDGTLYRVPATSSEAVRAVVSSDESPDGFSPVAAKVTSGADVIDEADLVRIEAPQGFRKDDTYTGPGTKYTDDAYDVIKFEPGDDSASEVGATDFIENLKSDKPVFAVYRRDDPDSILGASQSWANSQATIRADEPSLDEEEGRESNPVARLTDAEFDALNDDPEFDFDKFIDEQAGEVAEEEGDLYAAVQDLPDFEFKTPDGAYEPDLSSDYEPVGRTDQEAPNYTDDPAVLASMDYTEEELTDALSQALLGDDPNNPEGSGFGELDFDGGKEDVPAEALYEALYESGVDPDMAVAKIYDSALGGSENQDSLTRAREELFGVEQEEIAEIPEDEGAEKELPPAIEGATEDEKSAYLESGDWTPFLQDNQDFDDTGAYNVLDTEPYEPMSDEQRAEAYLSDAVFDSPVDLANAVSEEDLSAYLRESIEPDSDMPGFAAVSFEDEDGEIVEAYIPGEAIRDALQLQGVNTNELLDSIYAEPKEADGDKEPTDDEATEILEDMEDSILDLDLGELLKEKSEELKKQQELQDQMDWLNQRIEYYKHFAKYGYNMPKDGRIGMKPMSPEEIKKAKESARKELKKLQEQKAELQKQLDEEQGKVAEIPETDADEGGAKPPSGGKPSKFYAPDPDGVPDENMEYDQDYLKYLYESELEDLTVSELSDLQAMLSQIGPSAKFLVADKEAAVQEELIRRANMDDPDQDTPASDYPSTKFVGEEPVPSKDGPERRTYMVAGELGIAGKDLLSYMQDRYGSNIKSSSSKIPQEDLDQFFVDHNGLYGKDLLAAMNEWRAENDLPTTDIPEKAEETPAIPEVPESAPKGETEEEQFIRKLDITKWTDEELSEELNKLIEEELPKAAKGRGTGEAESVVDQIERIKAEQARRASSGEPDTEEVSEEDKFMDEFGLDIDMSNWVKDGEQAGSNEGAFYTDPATGMRYYVKKPKSAKHARNEALASAFYNEAGVRHGRIYIAKDEDGNEVLVSPIVQGDIQELGNTDWQNDPDILASAQDGFVMDAWLNNWDSVGAEYDNMIVKGKDVYRIDPGGALIFRAQGEDKADTLTPEAKQIDDLRFKGKKASSVFGSMTDEQITEDAKKLVGISPERISELVDTAFADDPETRDFVKENLLARRQTIMDRFGLTEDDYPKGNEESAADVVDELPGDTPDNEEQIIEEAKEADENTPFTPDGEADLVTDSATGDYTPDMKALFDIFINNPEAAKDFLDKVKQDDPWAEFYSVVDKLEEQLDKPDAPEKDNSEKAADEVVSDIVESEVDTLDDQDADIVDLDLEKEEFEKVDLELEDLLDDEDLGAADKVIKKILETYEAKSNGDGTFTLNSITRDGPDGKPQKLELKIQKNKDNTFSVLFVQTTWDDEGDPLERVVDKYAPRHSFKALSNNIQRGKSWIATFNANDSLSVDKFMKLVSKNTYKKIAGEGAIDAVKATHISADGVTELKAGDRVYNWKNGKWGTVAEVLPEYFGQGKHKVKQITADGEEVYGYTDYLKVRWDDNPGKALPVVSGSLFQIDPETGYAVNNVVPTLYNSKGKPKPKQPKKPESPDPQNPSPASSIPEEPELTPAPDVEEIDIPEPKQTEVSDAVEDIDDVDDLPDMPDEQVQDMIDGFGAEVLGFYNYKGEDVQILSMDKDGVTYRNVNTGETGTTPLIYWNQEEIDGLVDVPKMDIPSDAYKRFVGDHWVYNASDGTKTYMKLTNAGSMVTYQYIDKTGPKVKTISEEEFKKLAASGKITPGAQRKISPKDIRDIKEASVEPVNALGPAPEFTPTEGVKVSEVSEDGSSPIEGFASVEEAMDLVKKRKKSAYQHRISYDGDAISDMEISMGVAKVDGTEMTTLRFRLQESAAIELEQNISLSLIDNLESRSTSKGVQIPARKKLKSGMKITTDTPVEDFYTGETLTATLKDGTQIRLYRDSNGGAFVFGNTVEVYSPNKDFGKEDLDNLLQTIGIPSKNTSYPKQEQVKELAERRLLSYFRTGRHDSNYYSKRLHGFDVVAERKEKDLQEIKDQWGIDADNVVLEQAPDGRLALTLPDEVAQKIVDFTGVDTLYATTSGKNIDSVLAGANPGMQSTSQRIFNGVYKTSASGKTGAWSQESDMRTGGADYVFLRPSTPNNANHQGKTRIFVNPLEIFKRLDIFSYDTDRFGVKNPEDSAFTSWLGNYGTSGMGQPELLKKAAESADKNDNPEIMVRHNIPLPSILGYVFSMPGTRQDKIDLLQSLGVSQVNGIPIEEFLVNHGFNEGEAAKLTPQIAKIMMSKDK